MAQSGLSAMALSWSGVSAGVSVDTVPLEPSNVRVASMNNWTRVPADEDPRQRLLDEILGEMGVAAGEQAGGAVEIPRPRGGELQILRCLLRHVPVGPLVGSACLTPSTL
ncbi:hypothetical protein ABIA32_002346 [Streptacidiphilus sp. MAP12-20]